MKAFITPFEEPQRNVKIKIQVNFLSSALRRKGLITVKLIKDTHGEKAPSNETPCAYKKNKYGHLGF